MPFEKKRSKIETTIKEKNYPAGRGKFLKIIEGLLPTPKTKKKIKAFKIIDTYPICIAYYKNPKENIYLFSGHQQRKLGVEEIEELIAALLYIKALSLHKIPCFCAHNVPNPHMRLNQHIINHIREIHEKKKRWEKRRWKQIRKKYGDVFTAENSSKQKS